MTPDKKGVTMSKAANKMSFAQLPKSFEGMMGVLPLRPIRDKVDADNATEVIDAMAGHKLTSGQDDYLDALATLLEAYEAEHDPMPTGTLRGIDALKALLEENDMNASDLARLLGVHRSHGSKILLGTRGLSAWNIKTLCERFAVSADLFIA